MASIAFPPLLVVTVPLWLWMLYGWRKRRTAHQRNTRLRAQNARIRGIGRL